MEVSFWLGVILILFPLISSFNPCFYGSIFLTIEAFSRLLDEIGFNPCFYGSIFLTQKTPDLR